MLDPFTESLITAMRMQGRDIPKNPYIAPLISEMEDCLSFYARASSDELAKDAGKRAKSLLQKFKLSK